MIRAYGETMGSRAEPRAGFRQLDDVTGLYFSLSWEFISPKNEIKYNTTEKQFLGNFWQKATFVTLEKYFLVDPLTITASLSSGLVCTPRSGSVPSISRFSRARESKSNQQRSLRNWLALTWDMLLTSSKQGSIRLSGQLLVWWCGLRSHDPVTALSSSRQAAR